MAQLVQSQEHLSNNRVRCWCPQTVRVDKYRFTVWAEMNQTSAQPNFENIVATELYTHDEAP